MIRKSRIPVLGRHRLSLTVAHRMFMWGARWRGKDGYKTPASPRMGLHWCYLSANKIMDRSNSVRSGNGLTTCPTAHQPRPSTRLLRQQMPQQRTPQQRTPQQRTPRRRCTGLPETTHTSQISSRSDWWVLVPYVPMLRALYTHNHR